MKVFIDPGHGGEDNGAAYGYAEEDDLNLIISLLMRPHLVEHGFKVMLARESDKFLSLAMRCMLAGNWDADLFVSIHCDAFHNETTSGMSVHIWQDTIVSEPLGRAIVSALANRFPKHRERGLQRSDFYVLRKTHCPAALVECEFLSNLEMRHWLREPENQFALAEAIAQGIRNYKNLLIG